MSNSQEKEHPAAHTKKENKKSIFLVKELVIYRITYKHGFSDNQLLGILAISKKCHGLKSALFCLFLRTESALFSISASCPFQILAGALQTFIGSSGIPMLVRYKLNAEKIKVRNILNQRTIGPENAHLKPDLGVLSHNEMTLTLNTHTPLLTS